MIANRRLSRLAALPLIIVTCFSGVSVLNAQDPHEPLSDSMKALKKQWQIVINASQKDGTLIDTRLQEHSLYRFLGYVEGHLDATIPVPWEKALLSGFAYTEKSIYFKEPHADYKRDVEFFLGENVSVARQKGETEILVANTKCHLKAEDVALKKRKGHARLSARAGDNCVYLAFHGTGREIHVVKREATTSKDLWSREMTGALASDSFLGGRGEDAVIVTVDKDRVFVWQCASHGLCVEVLSDKTGLLVTRFSTR